MIQKTTAPVQVRSSSTNQTLQSNLSALAEKSQRKQALQSILLTLDRMNADPRQLENRDLVVLSVVLMLETDL